MGLYGNCSDGPVKSAWRATTTSSRLLANEHSTRYLLATLVGIRPSIVSPRGSSWFQTSGAVPKARPPICTPNAGKPPSSGTITSPAQMGTSSESGVVEEEVGGGWVEGVVDLSDC